MEIRQQIKEILKSKGLTRKRLTHQCGLGEQTIYNFLKGANSPTLYTLGIIADALDYEIVMIPKGNKNERNII